MQNLLADLLATDHPLFTRTIAEFETASGKAGVDTRLIADITERAHAVMRALNLDTADTSAEELYQALTASVAQGSAEGLLTDTDYVLLRFGDGPVSFNLQDCVENAHHELSFGDRQVGHAQRHLRAEIVKRYADHDRTDNAMVHNLAEQAGLKPESDEGHPVIKAVVSDAPSMLAIGDIFTDAFIRLSDEVAKLKKDDEGKLWVSIPFGGRPPYEEVEIVQSVGPSPNAAVSFARLGLRSELLSWLGDDKPGSDSLAYLAKQNVGTSMISVKMDTKSNYYYVLRVGAERTILTKDEDYDYVWHEPEREPDWVYLASISEASWQLHEDLLAYLEHHPDVKFALQPGTFHFIWGKEKMAGVFERAEIIILNREEAADMTGLGVDSISALAEGLHTLGPKQVVITDGPNGSYASFDGRLVRMPNYPDPAPPYDRTGAGDAFASTIVAALALGESMETALAWAPINSMSVVQKLGAQAGLLDRERITDYLKEAPDDYAPVDYAD